MAYDLIIVGAGPAGCAAAIRAASLRPEGVSRILLLDKAHFPRVKLCGGGIVRRGDYLLRRLRVDPDVHATTIDAARFVFPSGAVTIPRPGMFRVVRREEFDHGLLECVRSRGVHVQEGNVVQDLQQNGDGILVSTADKTFRARVVIGADGAGGVARKKVLAGRQRRSMVGLEVLTHLAGPELTAKRRRTAIFDFTCAADGVQGYAWHFPVGSGDSPQVNRGIFHSQLSEQPSRLSLKPYLVRSLHRQDIAVLPEQIKGHPLHMYDPELPCSVPHLLLAGDAIGVEPLLGEGISSALETGILAAETACRAFHSGDFRFCEYAAQVRASRRMRSIRFKRSVAERFYTRYPRWWVLLGAIGLSGVYSRATQAWDTAARRV